MRVHTYTAAESGLLVNSYLLETENGVVLVDANLLMSDIRALRARLDALHKPVLAAFVTHAHPDHFNGLPFVVDADVAVHASAPVARTIAEIADPKRAQWQPTYGEEWPGQYRVPDVTHADGEVVEIDGIGVEFADLGPGESHADSLLLVTDEDGRRFAFIGDLAFNGTHSYTADGHTQRWLRNLEQAAQRLAGQLLYPGHGAPGGVELLVAQRQYLLMYRASVTALAGTDGRLDEQAKARLVEAMTGYLPGAPLEWMIALGADAVAAELAGERALVP